MDIKRSDGQVLDGHVAGVGGVDAYADDAVCVRAAAAKRHWTAVVRALDDPGVLAVDCDPRAVAQVQSAGGR